jgi:hypothetical protein
MAEITENKKLSKMEKMELLKKQLEEVEKEAEEVEVEMTGPEIEAEIDNEQVVEKPKRGRKPKTAAQLEQFENMKKARQAKIAESKLIKVEKQKEEQEELEKKIVEKAIKLKKKQIKKQQVLDEVDSEEEIIILNKKGALKERVEKKLHPTGTSVKFIPFMNV